MCFELGRGEGGEEFRWIIIYCHNINRTEKVKDFKFCELEGRGRETNFGKERLISRLIIYLLLVKIYIWNEKKIVLKKLNFVCLVKEEDKGGSIILGGKKFRYD